MMDDLEDKWDSENIPIFCSDHRNKGLKIYKEKGFDGLKSRPKKNPKPNVNPMPAPPILEI